VQIVRLGEPSGIVPHAELLMLIHPSTLTIFRLAPILDEVSWLAPDLIAIRLLDRRKGEYAERIDIDDDGRFVGFSRLYSGIDQRLDRVAVTTDPELARSWQEAPDIRTAWKRLRRLVPPESRYATRMEARVFDAAVPEEQALFMRDIVKRWTRPDSTIDGLRQVRDGIWAYNGDAGPAGPAVRAPLWIGAGRQIPESAVAVGPALLWDAPEHRPSPGAVEWLEIEPTSAIAQRAKSPTRVQRRLKRLFDIVFALVALALTLPLYPFIALAIIIEDGFPIFFAHRRETLGGREFGCIKFRSMRKDAEHVKAQLSTQNQADGPQFFMENDPRLTRVGRVLRDFQLDELPQFINVLLGDMSVVGPRPSPRRENQFCPPWREARLSVRPGVTGLWQISRTRAVGADSQEWIKYDIEYVEKLSFRLDIWIIWRTILLIVQKVTKS
jgi:lipopolysaccharide/colanic/teichoic acid biosynthesis glycosyltransferase